MSRYHDRRSEFWRRTFEKALPWEAYVASGTATQGKDWRQARERIALTDEQRERLGTWKRTMHLLCLSGIWCGDCVRQGPMLQAIAEACPALELRFVDNREHPDVQEELRLNGGTRVPVLVTLSEDFFEVGRFGDRTLSFYRRRTAAREGAACAVGYVPPEEEALSTELTEWVDVVERHQLMLILAPMLQKRYRD